jgi:hypothetical protein
VYAVAGGLLPDGTRIMISGGFNEGTVWVWRLADGTLLVPPLALPESVRAVAVHGDLIITAAGSRHRRPPAGAPAAHALAAVLFPGKTAGQGNDRIMAGYPVHPQASVPVLTRGAAHGMRDSGTLSGTSAEEEQ